MCLGASNVSFGLPRRHTINASFLPMAMAAGLTSAIMSTAAECVAAFAAADLLLGHDPWGASWIAAYRGRARPQQAAAGPLSAEPQPRRPETRTEHCTTAAPRRVRLRFLPEDVEVRVPSGTAVFDAASWNAIAIDSTCGGYGTCEVRRADRLWRRFADGDRRRAGLQRARSCATAGAWPAGRTRSSDLDGRRAAASDPSRRRRSTGVGRHVILRPAVQKRHLALVEPTMEDQRSDLQRVLDAIDDLEPSVSLESAARARGDPARAPTSTSPPSSAARS